MTQINYSKIAWLVAYAAFAGISCWATEESLHLLLPNWPAIVMWIITIGFFLIASLGTKMIGDRFNSNIFIERPGLHLTGGIIITICFWLMCSMPTNTHTFFYRNAINDKVTTDISKTDGYLKQIEQNTNNKDYTISRINEFRNRVKIKLSELESEIENEANLGNGSRAEKILHEIAKLLSVPKIEQLSNKGTSKQDRIKIRNAYREKIFALMEIRVNNILEEMKKPNNDILKEVKSNIANLKTLKTNINNGNISLNNPEHMDKYVCKCLTEAYVTISKNRNFVKFNSEADEAKYTADNPVTDVKRMISVIEAWSDFLKGEYSGYNFGMWILISILVDVAAFIFFYLLTH